MGLRAGRDRRLVTRHRNHPRLARANMTELRVAYEIPALFSAFILCVSGTGCIQSHHAAPVAVYEPIPSPLTPTSDRPEARVYAPGQPAVSAPAVPPPAVRDSDVRLGQTISNLLKGDPHLADASGNVIATIENGVVTLHGKVPTEHDRYEIVERVSKLPGVAHVNDHLGIEGER